jgi:hypothetical protein
MALSVYLSQLMAGMIEWQRIKGKTCVLVLLFFTSCFDLSEEKRMRRENGVREPITRTHDSRKYPQTSIVFSNQEEAND